MKIRRQYIPKSDLVGVFNISKNKFLTILEDYDLEIKALDPAYKKTSRLLKPNVVDFLLNENGFTWSDYEDYMNEIRQKK